MRYWVVNKQRLQLPSIADEFTLVVALNQAQVMRQQLEDDAQMDKEFMAKAPEKFKMASSWKVFSEPELIWAKYWIQDMSHYDM
jgi:hypothetical protein